MTFTGLLDSIGRNFAKGLSWAVTYAVPLEKLVGLLFPQVAPATTALADATMLIQTAILQVEQKFAALGTQSGTGAQKLSEVMLLVEQVVTELLQQAGITADAGYIEKLISAVVAILNVQTVPAAATSPAKA